MLLRRIRRPDAISARERERERRARLQGARTLRRLWRRFRT